MKHIGNILKNHIETNHLKKRDIANAVGITYNYLSTIFTKQSIDCALFEKLCVVTGLNPMSVFDGVSGVHKSFSDIHAETVLGAATVAIGTDTKALLDLLAEKERLIQVLMATSGIKIGTISGQDNKETNV